MSKTSAACFDLWTSEVHKFSVFRTCILPESKMQLFLKSYVLGSAKCIFLSTFLFMRVLSFKKSKQTHTYYHFLPYHWWSLPPYNRCQLDPRCPSHSGHWLLVFFSCWTLSPTTASHPSVVVGMEPRLGVRGDFIVSYMSWFWLSTLLLSRQKFSFIIIFLLCV